MTKTIAYIRTSTDKQDLNNQKLEIFKFAKKNKLEVDDFIQMTISSKKTSKERSIDEMLLTLEDADTLIATELSRLGRSAAEVIGRCQCVTSIYIMPLLCMLQLTNSK